MPKKKKAASRRPAGASGPRRPKKSGIVTTFGGKAGKAAARSAGSRGKNGEPAALRAAETFKICPDNAFRFHDTSSLGKSHDIISQDRAVRAINMGLGIRKPGYNIYVAGIQGTGKTSVIRSFLEKWSANASAPRDWIYVYDFNDTEAPKAIPLAAGDGKKLKKKMEALVKNLRESVPKALQSEDYENAVNAYVSASNERKAKHYADLERLAKTMDFVIKSTRMGIETIPIVDGRSLSEKEYGKLADAERGVIEDKRSQLEPEVLDFARKVRAIEQETSEYVESLRNELGNTLVGSEIDPLIEEYKDMAEISAYLKEVKEHILENLLDFVDFEEQAQGENQREAFFSDEERDRYVKYRVNVFVDNTNTQGAPVIIETNPTYYNLFGRIEKNVEHGMYLTDFTMIKAGAVHRANGGYLVLNAMDVFKTSGIWDTLKRVLKNRMGFIEDMGEQFSLLPTSGLRPVPVPLDIKVIMIGNDEIYHALWDGDEDFAKIFKMKADFDYKMPREQENLNAYASFVSTRTQVESLLPFDRSGVAAVVEFGSRLVEDQRALSTQFSEIKDLTIESDYQAREEAAEIVTRDHVEKALDQKYYRLNLVEEQMLDMVRQEDVLLTISGQKVGQVNGLAVYDMGDYSFGKIGRITCTMSTTDEGVFNIERASKLSGKIHDKGVFIMSGFLTAVLAKTRGLGVAASVCFEQSYGLIDGDSATVAELISILSAMAEIPVDQSFAMTGSLNQFGEVQPIGGVNDKIEGCFKTAQILGGATKANPTSVMIPYQNVPNLMLHRDVRAAIDGGAFKIYPIRRINDAFKLVTGVELGFSSVLDKTFPEGSALALIQQKLTKLHKHHEEEQKPKKLAALPPKALKAEPKVAKPRR